MESPERWWMTDDIEWNNLKGSEKSRNMSCAEEEVYEDI
jgi:hypothetical protein